MTRRRPADERRPAADRGRAGDAGPGGDDRPADDRGLPPTTDIDWQSPRWRQGDEIQRDVERGRRFRGDAAPNQRGAVDAGRSVGGDEATAGPSDGPADGPSGGPADVPADEPADPRIRGKRGRGGPNSPR